MEPETITTTQPVQEVKVDSPVEVKIKQSVSDQKQNPIRLPLADHLGSEDEMRQVIQALVDYVAELEKRITALEGK